MSKFVLPMLMTVSVALIACDGANLNRRSKTSAAGDQGDAQPRAEAPVSPLTDAEAEGPKAAFICSGDDCSDDLPVYFDAEQTAGPTTRFAGKLPKDNDHIGSVDVSLEMDTEQCLNPAKTGFDAVCDAFHEATVDESSWQWEVKDSLFSHGHVYLLNVRIKTDDGAVIGVFRQRFGWRAPASDPGRVWDLKPDWGNTQYVYQNNHYTVTGPDDATFVIVKNSWLVSENTSYGMSIKKYDANGQEDRSWNVQVPFDNYNYVHGTALNSKGELFVVGNGFKPDFSAGVGNWIMKFDRNGFRDPAWSKTWPSGCESENRVIIDASDDVYVATCMKEGDDDATPAQYLIKKFAANGREVTKGFPIKTASTRELGMGLDSKGRLIVISAATNLVSAESGLDLRIERFSKEGAKDPAFAVTIDSVGDTNAQPQPGGAVKAFPNGDVLIAGLASIATDPSSDSSIKTWVRRYAPDGGEVMAWRHDVDDVGWWYNTFVNVSDIAVDKTGAAYLAISVKQQSTDKNYEGSIWEVYKIGPDGQMVTSGWPIKPIEGEGQSWVKGLSIVGERLYVSAGVSRSEKGQYSSPMVVRRYSLDGKVDPKFAIDQARRIGAKEDVLASAQASDGSIYIAGTGAQKKGDGASRIFLKRVTPDGKFDPAFDVIFELPGITDPNAVVLRAMMVDRDDGLFVAGNYRSSSNLDWKLWLRRYTKAGQLDARWNETFAKDTASSSNDLTALAEAADGSILVAGQSLPNWWIRKFRPTGVEDTAWSWEREVPFSCTGCDQPKALAVAGDGAVYLAGGGRDRDWDISKPQDHVTVWRIFKLKPDGGEDTGWDKQFAAGKYASANAISFDSAGNVFVGGYGLKDDETCDSEWRPGCQFGWIKKFSSAGIENTGWDIKYQSGDDAANAAVNVLAVDDQGRVYAGGSGLNLAGTATWADWWVRRFKTDASVDAWEKKIDGSGLGDELINVHLDGDELTLVGNASGLISPLSNTDVRLCRVKAK